MREMTFSRVFPNYHPLAGKPTNFPEKIIRALCIMDENNTTDFLSTAKIFTYANNYKLYCKENNFELLKAKDIFLPKSHTIRPGYRWKPGDWFAPKVWRGRPYHSTKLQFAPNIQVVKTWDIVIRTKPNFSIFIKNGTRPNMDITELANNDGLLIYDFWAWFDKVESFEGQIICWDPAIDY